MVSTIQCMYTYKYMSFGITVEPLLKDSPNKGHHRKCLPTKDTFFGPKNEPSHSVNTFFTSEEWTTSL